MKNDSSRNTFDARNHFSSVRMQQGRVQLDADWNEQSEIVTHRVETEASDIIGLCGGPLHNAAFRIVTDIGQLTEEEAKLPENQTLLNNFHVPDFLISAGRYYVDGILCENDQLTSYSGQPDLLDAMPVKDASLHYATPPQDTGLYLIYLDVWQRHLTALDVPGIREIALGGPDTATRTKTVWQVKSQFVGKDAKGDCLTAFKEYDEAIAPSSGKLSARTKREKASTDPCIVPPGAGYSGLENQLYRVEIHQGGKALDVSGGASGTPATRVENTTDQIVAQGGSWHAGQAIEIFSNKEGSPLLNGTLAYITDFNSDNNTLTLNINVSKITLDELHLREAKATYKWSRDNGVVVTSIENINETNSREITVHDLGPDDMLGFSVGQWVELIDDGLELNGLPGQLAQIAKIDTAINLITLSSTPLAAQTGGLVKARHPKLRRWDGVGAVKFHTSPTEEPYLDLESGVQVRFSPGTFKSGDYWTIPARTATADAQSGNIEWPQDSSNAPLPLSPFGIRHHYCRLAMLHWNGGGEVSGFDIVEDCRHLFPPLTELTSLFYLSGDGQEAMPNDPLPQLLQVGVFNGSWPVAGAHVQFTTQDGGRLAPEIAGLASGSNAQTIITGADGIASCAWMLNPQVNKPSQQVKAQLLDAPLLDANAEAQPPVIRFNGNLSIADQVFYDPGTCGTLQGQKTVQKALRHLTQLASIYKLSGDGQEIVLGEALNSLEVIVADSCGPIANQPVTFTIVAPGTGTVSDGNSGDKDSIDIPTNSDGIAACQWKPDQARPFQEVEATISTGPNAPPTVPPARVRFNATLSLASHVSYDPAKCPDLAAAGVKTVQEAIDSLCNIKPSTGGGCEVVVGEGGQFKQLDEAILKLLEDNHNDICICLLPGNHELSKGLSIGENPDQPAKIHIKIQGCGLGSRIFISEKPVLINQLTSFTLRDVAVEAENNLKPIRFSGCKEVIIEGCHLYGGLKGVPADLITIGNAVNIRIADNYFSSLWYGGLGISNINGLNIPAPVPFMPQRFDSLLPNMLGQLSAASPDVRKQFTDSYRKFLKSRTDLPPALRNSIETALKIVSTLGRGAANRDSNTITEIDAVSVLAMGNALVLLDEMADTLIENNRFYGGIALYGNEGRFSDEEWKSFVRSMLTGEAELINPAPGALRIRSNHLSGIYVDRSIVNQVHALSPPDQLKRLEGLLQSFLFTDNWCQPSSNQLLAQHLNLSSNHFNFGGQAPYDAGTIAGNSAIIIGNAAYNPKNPLFFFVNGNLLQAVANILELTKVQ